MPIRHSFLALILAAVFTVSLAHAQNEPWRAINLDAATLLRSGKYAEALALAEKSLPMCDTAGASAFLCRGIFHENIAEASESLGHPDRAEAEYKQFLDIRERDLPSGHPLIAEPLWRLGWFYQKQRKWTESLPYLNESVDILRTGGPANQPTLIAVLAVVEISDMEARQYEAAVQADRELIALNDKMGAAGAEAGFRARYNLIKSLGYAGHGTEAVALGNEVFDYARRTNHGETDLYHIVTRTTNSASFGHAPTDVLPLIETARRLDDSRVPLVAKHEFHFAVSRVLEDLGRRPEAVTELERALALAEEGKEDAATIAAIVMRLANQEKWTQRYEPALIHYRRAKALYEQTQGHDSLPVADAILGEADILAAGDDKRTAVALLHEQTRILTLASGSVGEFLSAELRAAKWNLDLGDFAAAQHSADAAAERVAALPDPPAQGRLEVLTALANVAIFRNQFEKALQLAGQAAVIFQGDEAIDPLPKLQAGMTLASVFSSADRPADAIRIINIAIQTTGGEDSQNLDVVPGLVVRGRAEMALGKNAEAASDCGKASKLIPPTASNTNWVQSTDCYANAVFAQEKYKEAAGLFQSILTVLGSDPARAVNERVAALMGLGESQTQLARYPEAEKSLASALSLAEASGDVGVPKLPVIFQWRSELMSGLGRYANAVADARRAIEIADRIGALERHRMVYQSEFGRALLSAGEPAEADIPLREAKEYYERNGPERELRLARENLAVVALMQGRDQEAAATFTVLVGEQVRAGLAESSGHATTLGRLSLAQASLGNSAEAERLLREAIEIDINLLGSDNPGQGRRLVRLAGMLEARGAVQEARSIRRSAIELMTKGFGADNPMVVLARLGELPDLLRDGEIAAGTAIINHCVMVIAATIGPESADMADCLGDGARWELKLGDLTAAARDAEHALAIGTRVHGGLTPRSIWMILLQSEIDLADDRPADALARCDTAQRLLGGRPAGPERVSVLAVRAAAQAAMESASDAVATLREALDAILPGADSDAVIRRIGVTSELATLLVHIDRGGEAEALWTDLPARTPPAWAMPAINRGLAVTEATIGHPTQAIDAYDRALAMDRASLGDAALETVTDEASAAAVLADLGRFDLAADRVRAIPTGRTPWMDILRVGLLRSLAVRQGDFSGASVHQARLVALVTAAYGADTPFLLPELVRQGRLDLLVGRRDEAVALLPRAEALAVHHARLAGMGLLMFRAEMARAKGRMDDAEQAYRAAIGISAGPLGGPVDEAFSRAALGEFYLTANRAADAGPELRAALKMAERHIGPASLFTGAVLLLLARLDDQTDDAKEAASFRARATAIFGAGVGTVKMGRWL